jgi:YidC/Oxa1 family membrane protein insertase
VMLAENALFADVGKIFHPLFDAIGWVLALIYGLIPNYAVAIALLTVLIMLLLTPLTVKSTRSMIAMQALQPEIKKLQAKYKGPDNRQKLNEELMALYKEKGINPAGGCLPMFLQMPFLIILYDTIKGLVNVVPTKINGVVHNLVEPRYIPKQPANATSVSLTHKLYAALVAGHGHMLVAGMDLANKPFGHGLSATQRIPYFVMVGLAVGLQYFQMRQMSNRNPQAAANKQMQTIQKITPVLFAYIYFLVPAAVVVYMIVSTLIRILTQDIMFRTGMVQIGGGERSIGAAKGSINGAAAAALVEDTAAETPPKNQPKGNGSGTRRPTTSGNGKGSVNGSGSTNGAKSKPSHPRAQGKRPRKAR